MHAFAAVRAACALASAILLSVAPSPAARAAEAPPVTLAGSAEYVLGTDPAEALRLVVSVPPGPAPEGGYAVLYAFDGNSSIGLLGDLADDVASLARRSGRTPVLVVGIDRLPSAAGTDRRILDLTPFAESYDMPARPNNLPWPALGGGDDLLDRLETEVLPLIHARYDVDETRETLFGHSLGGNLVLHAAFTRPALFDAYAASSPSIWVNNRQVAREAEVFLATRQLREQPLRLMMTVGSEEQSLSPWEAEQPRTVEARLAWKAKNRMVGNAMDLAALLTGKSAGRVDMSFSVLEGEDHQSARPIAAYRALRFATGPR